MAEQLLLFDRKITEFDTLWEEIAKLKHSQEKVRKRLFRELKELEEAIIKTNAENDKIRAENDRLRNEIKTKTEKINGKITINSKNNRL